ncbi:MAG: transglycosylase SLT domain-containing protein [Candidatus Pacearchaeota archaeon]
MKFTNYLTRIGLGVGLILGGVGLFNGNSLEAKVNKTDKKVVKYDEYKYDSLILKESQETSLDKYLIKGQIKQESRFNPNAKSPVGAVGLSQIMPDTAKELGYKPNEMYEPGKAIDAQTRYMRQMYDYKEFEKYIGDEKTKLALASYNAGYGNIRHAVRIIQNARNGEKEYKITKGSGKKKKVIRVLKIENLKECPENWDNGFSKALELVAGKRAAETQDYVSKVIRYREEYLLDGKSFR